MIGAIIGDIVGSRFEFKEHYGKDFALFADGCRFTDDTLMTLAVAKALLLSKGNYDDLSELAVRAMKDIAKPYLRIGWGNMFYKWLFEKKQTLLQLRERRRDENKPRRLGCGIGRKSEKSLKKSYGNFA